MTKNKIKQIVRRIYHRLPRRVWIFIGAFSFLLVLYVLLFAFPKQVDFSYAAETCVPHITVAPTSIRQTTQSGYSAQLKDTTAVRGMKLFSTSLCFTPTKTPTVGNHTVIISPLGGWFAAKRFTIKIPEVPKVQTDKLINATIPTTRSLKIPLSSKDEVFQYKLITNQKSADCSYKDTAINCDIPALTLTQGANYDVTLERHFDDKKISTVTSGKITTLLPLKQTSASVADGQVVYDKLNQLIFTYDKPLLKAEATLKKQVGDTWEVVPTTIDTKDSSLTITPTAELTRKTQFELTIAHAESEDGSSLDGPTIIHFSTSGGPKVAGISIPSYGIAQSGTIIITLDQEVADTSKLSDFIIAQGVAATVTKSGNTLRLNYSNAPFCGALSISVKKGLESKAGVMSDEDWSFNTRTICHTTRTIGASTQGRAIIAHTFGSGSKTILYTGSIHGNENSARLLMNAWVNELEASAEKIPAGTRIIVVPSLNPDGTAANSRYNTNTVDLNRNFNVSDWKKDIQTVGGQPLPNGGGSAPESEAETRVIVNFSKEVAPYLTMSYHSSAAYAIGNGCGNSPALAGRYAQLSGYRNMTGVSGAFSYEITGTYDDWLCEKLGRQSVLIELATSTSAEFARNKTALWEMARS